MADKKFITISGIELKEVYTEPSGMTELPGQFPYTRGIQKNMYRGKPWTMRQYAGFSTAEESNKRYHYLLSQGTMGLSVAFDLPTQIGYDSDHELSEGEVGKVGVAIDSLKDIEILFDGIQLKNITTSMTINATASILLAMYIALAKKQGADLKQISGTIQNDILKEYAARGTYIYPPTPSMRLITDIFEYCSKEVPKWNTISISGYHIREAGSTAVQELAFTLANGKTYLKAALEKGLDINVFAKRLSFFFNCHNNFFEEIAKFRAARRMWAHITKELGATDPGAQKLRFHTQTGGSTLTAQQPMNNIVRVSMQALAAVLGGTQSLHTNGYDEALSLPTEAAAKIALRTQQIIAFESGVTDTVDPLAGSFFIEALTDELEAAAQLYIDKIDAMGGSVKAIEQDYIQQEIAAAAYQYQNDIESGDQTLVGVNKFTQAEEVNPNVFRVDDAIRRQQIDKLVRLKEERNNDAVAKALQNLTVAARGTDNLMPYILNAVECYATLGEIADTLRNIFGEY
ncbi:MULTISPECIES: methylmalonyl-CoA mutase family protein [unclassified Mucilaginibacter]|uniref:acyl-CoA mutase large subunit family protein n=1 Tax=unclassified Mucilaginibacter TaxID=2617802 RepID=UPI002AC9703A|nr:MULTISPECIES: methylmalonyl-CoA mutase family protein [unclassified Mucilaginibacter]MEB0261051.1 methylmalonyl-CoA mutase family protein [Mucilaginibacter sp. 10I4]MEB0278724.1 methylmalonyl-CoA mutase family protein [Mucilaginibacter sp. 10B2]MEB0301742.1 methylmalonyl-CoA mutase family protein [Mucilaginibacter sp. 5C4]WPX23324.1 methylmalonyl-CoA mutase family protein [Mucilaginibacter sp. 5C4]